MLYLRDIQVEKSSFSAKDFSLINQRNNTQITVMEEGSNQVSACNGFRVSNIQLNSILKKNSHAPSGVSCSIHSRLPNSQYSASTNRLQNEESGVRSNQLPDIYSSLSDKRLRGDEFGSKHSRLKSSDSGASCKYNHYSSSSTEESNNSSENRGTILSGRNDEAQSKSVSFSLESSPNFTDERLFVTDIDIDSDLESDSDLTFFNTESASTGQGNGDSGSPGHNYASRLSRGSTGRNSIRGNNTTPKKHRSAYSGNSIMPSNYNYSSTQSDTSYNADCKTDQRSFLQHQQLPGPLYSIRNEGRDNFQEDLPCYSHSKCEAISSKCHPGIHREVDHNFDPQSSAPLVDDSQDTESQPSCTASQESIPKSAVCNTRSCYTNKAIKACFVILMVFNIILLVAIGFLISMLLNQQTHQECPLCKDIIDHAKSLNGGNINELAIQEYLKENDKNGRCCLDHAFILKLMAHINSNPLELSKNNTTYADTLIKIIRNAQQKAAIHLQSVPLSSNHSGQMDGSISWNFKEATSVENIWNKTDSDTEILIPLTGVYYIYAMVQYQYINPNSTRGHDSMPAFEAYPLSVSLYKIPYSETNRSRIGTVTLHCRFASQSIEHNIIIQKIVQLTKGDKVSLVVSNWQFLNNKQNMHQIGLFKVD